jgi:hypothetical protein
VAKQSQRKHRIKDVKPIIPVVPPDDPLYKELPRISFPNSVMIAKRARKTGGEQSGK